jgi:membrane protease YdiL (CAAX protease family)
VIPLPEGGEGNESFPTTSGAIVLAIIALVARFMSAEFMAGLMGPRPAVLGMSAIVGYGIAFAFAVRNLPPSPGPRLGFLRAGSRAWRAIPFLLCSVLLISEVDNLVQEFLPLPEGLRGAEVADLAGLVERFLVIALAIPLVEEVFYRGLLQPGLVNSLDRLRGVAVTTALQTAGALVLSGPWVLPFALGYGLLLGLLREAGGSLWPCLALRVGFGVITFLAYIGSFGIAGFDDMSAPHTPLIYLLPAALLLGVGLGLCRAALRSDVPYTPPNAEPPEQP